MYDAHVHIAPDVVSGGIKYLVLVCTCEEVADGESVDIPQSSACGCSKLTLQ